MARNEDYWWDILPVGILDDIEIISREIEKRNLSPVLEVEELSSEDDSKGNFRISYVSCKVQYSPKGLIRVQKSPEIFQIFTESSFFRRILGMPSKCDK